MAQELTIEQKLNDLLETHNLHPEMLGKDGRPCKDASTAKTFSFDYVGESGKNYGTMVVILGDDNEMFIMYGDNLGKTMEDHSDRSEFFEFQQTLMTLANRNRWHGTLTDLSKLKHVQAGIAAITEGLFEGYYGNKRVSYAGEPTEARLMLKHNRVLGENDARFRYVESIFIETADGERFKLPFTNLGGGRAMLEHVKQGGKPYDIRGNHICEMVGELKVLTRFNRASASRVMEGVTQEIAEQAKTYYKNLREHIKRMSTHRGYSTYFESWHPAESLEHEELVEDIKTMFIEQTLDTRIEDALPLLARIKQGNVMKEADIFESWIDHLSEGTWNLPETPEQLDKLKQLMSNELIVGPDATNATEQLYDLVGDDILFDRLSALADRDPRANAWDDTEVMSRLSELGIQTPEPGTMAEPDPMAAPDTGQQPPVAEGYYKDPDGDDESEEDEDDLREGSLNELSSNTLSSYGKKAEKSNDNKLDKAADHTKKATDLYAKGTASAVAKSFDHEDQANKLHKQVNKRDAGMDRAAGKLKKQMSKGMMEGENFATFEDIHSLTKLAGIPVAESRLMDSTGETIDHVLNRFKHEVRNFEATGDLDDDLYHALYDYYSDNGEMPYGTMKARTGDPYEWVSDRLAKELSIDEGVLGTVGGAMLGSMMGPVGAAAGAVGGQELTKGGSGIAEGSCNQTMEGEYCPEHGLMECGMAEGANDTTMGTLGQTVGTVIPKPSDFVAGFKKTFEDRESDVLLARIKSLALIR